VTSQFFHRLAKGVFDIRDLKFRTNELADFVERPSIVYAFYAKRLWQLVIQMAPILQQAFSCSGLIPIRWSTVSLYGPSYTMNIARSLQEAYFHVSWKI
jgi:hypothetical protein